MASEHRYALKLIGIAAAAAAAVIIACETDISPVGPVDSVSQLVVSPHTVTLQPGEAQAFMAVGFTAAGDTAQINVTWSVTGGSLVDTSSAGGRHYGDYEGTSCGGFKVAATSHPGEKSDTASVAVVCPPPAVASVDVTPPSASMQADQTVQLTATPKDANGAPLSGRTVTWSSSNTAVATVSNGGLVSGVTPGTATITATSEGKSGTSTITVTPVPVASVEVTPATASVQAGQTVQLTATPRDAGGNPLSGRTVTWSSSNTSVAAVSNSGLVSGVTPGSATITATSEGKSGTSSVTVTNVPVATVDVSPPSASVQAGQTVQLTATPRDAGGNPLSGRTVTWSSSNTSIAAVSTSGLVSGVTPGSVTISATSEGKSGTAAITVTSSGGAPFGHVFIVVEENTNYASVIGSSAMPYLSSLAQQYGLATQYYANTHPSIGNYFMMTVGDIFTNDDSYGGTVSEDNVVRQLLKAGRTWKSYAEDLPSVGYHTPGETGNYASRHNPFSYLTDVVNDPVQLNNLVPITQFPTDLANGALPNYSFLVPNLCYYAHDFSLGTAATWS